MRHAPNVEQYNQNTESVKLQEQGKPDGWILATDASGWVKVRQ